MPPAYRRLRIGRIGNLGITDVALLAGVDLGLATLICPGGMFLPVLLAPLFLYGANRAVVQGLESRVAWGRRCAAAGLGHLSRTRQYWVVYGLSVFICYVTAIVLGRTAYSRFRMPFMPFLSLLAAIGLLSWLRRRRRAASTPI